MMPQNLTEADLLQYSQLQGQPQPQISQYDPNTIYAENLKEEKLHNILQQINPDNIMADIEHRIKGYRKDIMTNEWVKINKDSPELNAELVSNFMSFLGSILNQNTSMSNFSASEINGIMDMLIEYIADDLDVNDKKYGLEGEYQEMSRIGNIISMTVFTVLKRAQNGMEARRIFSALKINENLTQAPQQKGMLDAMKFWK